MALLALAGAAFACACDGTPPEGGPSAPTPPGSTAGTHAPMGGAMSPAGSAAGSAGTGASSPVGGRGVIAGTGGAGCGAGSAAGGSGGAVGSAGESGGSGAAGTAAPSDTGTLPPAGDLEAEGPFTPAIMDGTGPDEDYRLYLPEELGRDGVRHPVVLFAAGGGFPDNYTTLLRHIASHGFVVLTFWTTPRGTELLVGLDWLIAQGEGSSGLLAGKLDTDHVAVSGHSFGSLIAFLNATDPRIATTVHLQGGTLDPHTEVANLRAPALFLCGEPPMGGDDGVFMGDMATPNCTIDFQMAEAPVFYGSLAGAAHVQLTESVQAGDPLRLEMIGAVIGWLRWQLAGDSTQRARYVGPDCELCKPGSGWTVMQKGLM